MISHSVFSQHGASLRNSRPTVPRYASGHSTRPGMPVKRKIQSVTCDRCLISVFLRMIAARLPGSTLSSGTGFVTMTRLVQGNHCGPTLLHDCPLQLGEMPITRNDSQILITCCTTDLFRRPLQTVHLVAAVDIQSGSTLPRGRIRRNLCNYLPSDKLHVLNQASLISGCPEHSKRSHHAPIMFFTLLMQHS